MLKGLIFDIGGVLTYGINEYVFAPDGPIVTRYHLEPQKVIQISAKLWQKYAHTANDYESTWQEVEQHYWNEFKSETSLTVPNSELIDLVKEAIRPIPYMPQLLASLKAQNFDLLICSNNTEFFYQRQKDLAGFGQYFQKNKVILSSHHGAPKEEESATLFQALEKQMDFPKENYLFIDDSKENIAAGLKYGLTSILFPADATYGHTYIEEIIKRLKENI